MLFLRAILLFVAGIYAVSGLNPAVNSSVPQSETQAQIKVQTSSPTPSVNPTRTSVPIQSAIPIPTPKPTVQTLGNYAHQVFNALNEYRKEHGVAAMNWNNSLAGFAQNRSGHLQSIGSLDGHAGFEDFIHNQNGFNRLGFWELGENQGYSSAMPSPHDLIFNQYASSPPHNQNQLNSDWSDVGVGISGNYSDIVFGGKKR